MGILSAPPTAPPPGAHAPSLRRSLLRLPRDASESRFRDGGDRGSRVRHPTRARPPPLSASLPDGAIDEPTQTRHHLPKSQLTSEGPGRCTFYGAGQVCDDFRPPSQGLTGTFPALISCRSLMFPDKGQSPVGRRVGSRQGPGHSLLIPTASVSRAKTACDPPPRAEPSALTARPPLPPAPHCGPLLAPSRGSVHSPGVGGPAIRFRLASMPHASGPGGAEAGGQAAEGSADPASPGLDASPWARPAGACGGTWKWSSQL